MPYLGLSPFLHLITPQMIRSGKMCQCPISGYPHFYAGIKLVDTGVALCQCPISGYPHFYRMLTSSNLSMIMMCQCPISGYPHFYHHRKAVVETQVKCVNALSRAIPISTMTTVLTTLRKFSVSMPYLGLSPFLLKSVEQFMKIPCVCQCPISGYPHFYGHLSEPA